MEIKFYTKSGLLVAEGYTNVVIGQRGPYIGFDKENIIKSGIHIPEEELFRIKDNSVYYIEFRTNNVDNVKIYLQKREVDYAAYKLGRFYISPFDLNLEGNKEIISPLHGK